MSTAPTTGRPGLALVGYRGTGKTTVGRLVAGRLGRPFVDADLALEARAGTTVRAVFEERGEPAFRDLEESILAELTAEPNRVLATGGGVVLREANRRALRRFGFVVWLRADPSALATRLLTDPSAVADRPALTAAGTVGEIAGVLAAREPLYREVADAVIETSGVNPVGVAEAVLDALAAVR